jgi:hypothetical protein
MFRETLVELTYGLFEVSLFSIVLLKMTLKVIHLMNMYIERLVSQKYVI